MNLLKFQKCLLVMMWVYWSYNSDSKDFPIKCKYWGWTGRQKDNKHVSQINGEAAKHLLLNLFSVTHTKKTLKE